MALKGKPIGMYHCNYCGQMILAGLDPSIMCPVIDSRKWVGPPEEYNEMMEGIPDDKSV